MPVEPLEDEARHRIEHRVGTLLRSGVLLAAAVSAVGGVAVLVQHGRAIADYRVFHGEPAELRGVRAVLAGVGRLDSHALVQLGLILLIATPVARVLLSLVGFAVRRDRLYVVITSVVLAVLLFSFLLGGRV